MRGAVTWRGGKGMGRAGDRGRSAAGAAMRSRGLAVAVVAVMALFERCVLPGAHGEGGLKRHADGEQQNEKPAERNVPHNEDSYSISS